MYDGLDFDRVASDFINRSDGLAEFLSARVFLLQAAYELIHPRPEQADGVGCERVEVVLVRDLDVADAEDRSRVGKWISWP